MHFVQRLTVLLGIALATSASVAPSAATALENLRFEIEGDSQSLRDHLVGASLVKTAKDENRVDARELVAVAGAEYAQLTGALYKKGYYGGTINVFVDGREAASISPFAPPSTIREIIIRVNPGPAFRFGTTSVTPVPSETVLPDSFQDGQTALAPVVGKAARSGVAAWREIGYAKAKIAGQNIVADHKTNTLDVDVTLSSGPKVRFGDLRLTTKSAVRAQRLQEIAGLPTGEVFSPNDLETVTKRLRRTGTFRSVALTEADALRNGDVLDIDLAIQDEKPRRFGFGAELSSTEGVKLSGFWLHRNLLGGAERLRLDAEISGLGSQAGGTHGGIDYMLGARFDRPATFRADTSLYALGIIERLDEPNFLSDQVAVELGLQRILSERLTVEAGFGLRYSQETTTSGKEEFTHFVLPVKAALDERDKPLNPSKGYYLAAEGTPFIGLNGSATGGRLYVDGRIYRGIGNEDKIVLAGRFQLGSVVGSELSETPQDFLFYSGGGNTVRGQPYQSLGVSQGGTTTGGRSFVGISSEIRADVGKNLGVVAFVDAGYIGSESLYDGSGNWHSGGGLGLRYDTGIGPIRLDVATPLDGDTGDGVQIYIGIGQAF